MGDDSLIEDAGSKRQKGSKLLFWTAIIILLAVITNLTMDLASENSWKKVQRQMSAQGESLDFANYIPKPIPDDRNFALAPIVASSYSEFLDPSGKAFFPPKTDITNQLDMNIYDYEGKTEFPTNHLIGWVQGEKTDLRAQQMYYRALAAETNLFQIPPQPGSPAQDVLLALSKYDSNIDKLKIACRLPDSRFPLNYGDFEILQPQLQLCIQMLNLRAIAELQNGQSQPALDDIETSLRLIESIRTEPFVYSGLDRVQWFTGTIQPIWEGLNEHTWSSAQLDRLNKDLQEFDFVSDYKFDLRGQLACDLRDLEYVRYTRRLDLYLDYNMSAYDELNRSYSDGFITTRQKILYHAIPNWFFYQNEINLVKAYQNWALPIVDTKKEIISPDAENTAEHQVEIELSNPSLNQKFLLWCFVGVPDVSMHFAFSQDAVNMARIACALELYRLEYGDYPQTLNILVPRFIDNVPHDVINGQPLKYHVSSDGKYVLYSVGWNKIDDGGLAALNNGHYVDKINGDWIWNGTGVTNEMLHP